MSVDKLVDSTQLDADLTSVANAIRTKGGTSASLAFPAEFVSAIAAIPSGGGVKCETGSFTLSDDSRTVSFSVSFNPKHIMCYAMDSDLGTANTWKVWNYFQTDPNQKIIRVLKYGASSVNGAAIAASNASYSNGTLTLNTADNSYKFVGGVTYYWVCVEEIV